MRSPAPRGLACLVLALGLAACTRTDDGAGQPAGEFYRGKTVSIVVGSGAGGGFDTTARLVARHIGRHIPGAPTVIVVNMPAFVAAVSPIYGEARKQYGRELLGLVNLT